MQQVYTVKPYLNFYENICPLDVMYSMKSYHDVSCNNGLMGSNANDFISVDESLKEIINRHQLELIEELTTFIDHLNKALTSCSSSVKIKSTFAEPKTLPKVQQQQFAFRKGKVGNSPVKEMDSYYPAALSTFEILKYPLNMITLFIDDIEKLWLKNLAKIGSRASILFERLNDGISAPVCVVKLQASNSGKF
ncbi:unnamed protein product [Onchocerca flexuosa]|uniref:Uncharacterized protein n=1 Tax=Onchocerca flexuosa TaxID=387005 RepID=A0A183HZS8_9BILA|nr:unnamed protein product [Onchocerca flexuosa]